VTSRECAKPQRIGIAKDCEVRLGMRNASATDVRPVHGQRGGTASHSADWLDPIDCFRIQASGTRMRLA
jgi:hypothetical protein